MSTVDNMALLSFVPYFLSPAHSIYSLFRKYAANTDRRDFLKKYNKNIR